jgi:hypothetical protein
MASEFPRPLTSFERSAIDRLLPADRIGYTPYREFVAHSIVIGEGRWGPGDLILAPKMSSIDLNEGMTPVVAFGEFVVSKGANAVTLTINEPRDEQMEVQVASDVSLADLPDARIESVWTPSDYLPCHDPLVREVPLRDATTLVRYWFVINPIRRMLWIHYADTRFNQLIPVTGFYEYLLRYLPPKDRKSLNARVLFDDLPILTDDKLRTALLHYNLENPKFDSSMIVTTSPPKPGFLQRLLQRFSKHD